MDYISIEEWGEVSKWLEISQKFYEAYTRFRIESTSVHCFDINDRHIEVSFSYANNKLNWVDVNVYCPDSDAKFYEWFILEEEGYRIENRITKLIIAEIYGIAWGSLSPEVFRITTGDSENAYKQIEKILTEKDSQCFDAFMEEACLLGNQYIECIIELYGRQILVHSQNNSANEDCTDFWLECIDTGRNLLQVVGDLRGTLEDAIQKILYLALEPECFNINTTDSEWEYELIKAIIVNAIHICQYANCFDKKMEERLIELHNRQIRIRFQCKDRSSINIFLDCVTTGRSNYCVVRDFEDNPEEAIWNIQELGWEDMQ